MVVCDFNLIVHFEMPCFQAQLRLSVFHIPNNRAHRHIYRPRFGYVAVPLVKPLSNHSSSVITNSSRLNSLQTIDIDINNNNNINIEERQILIDEALAINRNEDLENVGIIDLKEKRRREKIGLANKGHVPWNKGKQYDAETRERISQKTIEALKNPKVRQKMVECRQAYNHSEKAKKRIGSSIRRFWAKRLKWKRSRERFYNSWAESIVKAAKMGQTEQDLAKRELEVPAMVIKSRKPRTVRKLHMETREEKEEKEKLKRKMKLDKKDSRRRLKLKERLNQIRQKVSNYGNVPCQKGIVTSHIQGMEKLDLELMKSECFKRQVSLADQIRAAKNKKAELSTAEALTA